MTNPFIPRTHAQTHTQTARGSAPESLIDTAYTDTMITLPMAPSDGLFLDKPSFDKYNHRAPECGMGGSLDWEADPSRARGPPPPPGLKERIEAFKDAHIVGHITREVRRRRMDPHTCVFCVCHVLSISFGGLCDMHGPFYLHERMNNTCIVPNHHTTTQQEPRTLAFSKWLYHLRQRFEKRGRAFQPRELTIAEVRSEVPKKHRPK